MIGDIWLIAFRDGEEEVYREEFYDDEGDYNDLGNIIVFDSKEKADKFIFDKCDEVAYDFYSKPFIEEELEDYCKKYECGCRYFEENDI